MPVGSRRFFRQFYALFVADKSYSEVGPMLLIDNSGPAAGAGC